MTVSLGRSWMLVTAARVATMGAAAVGALITARALGAEERGVLAAVLAAQQIAATAGALNAGNALLARRTAPPAPVVARLTALNLAVAVAVFAVVVLLAAIPWRPVILAAGAALAASAAVEQAYLPYAIAHGALESVARLTVALRCAEAAVVATVAWMGRLDALGWLVVDLVVTTLVAARVWQSLQAHQGPAPAPDPAPDRPAVSERPWAWLQANTAGAALLQYGDALVVFRIAGPAVAAGYQAAAQGFGIVLAPAVALGQLISHTAWRDGADAALRRYRTAVAGLGIAIGLTALAAIVVAPWLYATLLGPAYRPLAWTAAAAVFALPGKLFAALFSALWVVVGAYRTMSVLTLAVAVVGYAVAAGIGASWGAPAATIGAAVPWAGVLVANGWLVARIRREAR